MSSVGAVGAGGSSGVGGSGGWGGRKRGRLLGSRNKDKSLVVAPSVPRKRGRLLGSRNKKTLAALAAAAAMVSTEAATTIDVGNSCGVVAGAARQPWRPPKKQ
jgi:hypothetical protein